LVAASSDVVLSLQNGIPLRDDLQADEYEYFLLPVDDPNADITVTVTDLGSGDPDLFISTIYTHPNETANEWHAQRLRGDSITISHTDPKACHRSGKCGGLWWRA
jgi:hypothetical protein